MIALELARTIAAAVREGRVTAEQTTRDALDRIQDFDAVQPQIWIERPSADAVLAQARAVDARIAAGEALPLAGVPYAVKDNIDVAGMPTTAACPTFAYTPARSAAVIERLQEAGAVMLGKTNLDQFATGLVGVRSPYGAPACAYNRAYISGGSSSGSAVVVAAALVAFALGSDTAGSGRVPAAINGLVGLKPTRGRWSTRGLVPACRSLDCVSVFSRDAADAVLIDSVLAGFDPEDPYSRSAQEAGHVFERRRFGVPIPRQLNVFGDRESAALFEAAVGRLEAMGGTPVEVDIGPLLQAGALLYGGPWVAERMTAIEQLLRTTPSVIETTVRAIVQGGAAVSGVETFRGLHALQAFARSAEAIWAEVDVLVLPTAPTVYRIAEVQAEPVTLNSNLGLYTSFANLLDMSAVAVPAGWRDNATGFGVSLIGPAWSDKALLELAARYEAAGPTLTRPPLDKAPRRETIRLAVVGAHLSGMPLNWQLKSRGARLCTRTRTAPTYRLYAMTQSQPMKPALIHADGQGGAAIEVEVYELAVEAFGSFVAEVLPPLAIGSVTLEDGSTVKGFLAEPRAISGALEITDFAGWRAYVASL